MYLDAALDDLTETARSSFESAVEASRMGTIFAHDDKQYGKWRRGVDRGTHSGLSGAALEAAVMNIAAMFPENVVRGTL